MSKYITEIKPIDIDKGILRLRSVIDTRAKFLRNVNLIPELDAYCRELTTVLNILIALKADE